MSFLTVLDHLKNLDIVNLRFAPSPNGMATIGHLKGLLVLDHLKERLKTEYDKKVNLYLRFDDTNPAEQYKKQYYDSFYDLVKTFNIAIDGVSYSSDSHSRRRYLESLYVLKSKSRLYICKCEALETVKEKRFCSCLEDKDLQSRLFEDLKNETIKFIPQDKNLSPYVLYRKVSCETDTYYSPTIALQGPVDDEYYNINCILRGRDLESLTTRQKEVYEALYDKQYPLVFYWGRVDIWNSETLEKWSISKSALKSTLNFPCLGAFFQSGYSATAIAQWILSYNLTKNDIKWDIIKLNYFQKTTLKGLETVSSDFLVNREYLNIKNSFYFKCFYDIDFKQVLKKKQVYYWNFKTKVLVKF